METVSKGNNYARSLARQVAGYMAAAGLAQVRRTWQARKRSSSAPARTYKRFKGKYTKPYKKSKYFTKTNFKMKKLNRSVRTLQRKQNSDEGTLIYRDRGSGFHLCSSNQVFMVAYIGLNATVLELALAQLRYYDPSNPGTLLQPAVVTRSIKYDFSAYGKYKVRNNYNIPCEVRAYLCDVKSDTSTDPLQAVSAGFADVGGMATTNPLAYPTDSPIFKNLWNIRKCYKFVIGPGSERNFSFFYGKGRYDPSFFDTHALTYMKMAKGTSVLFRIHGPLAHDSGPLVGRANCGVDIEQNRTIRITYPAGINTVYIHTVDSSDVFTATPLVNQKPAPAFAAYAAT